MIKKKSFELGTCYVVLAIKINATYQGFISSGRTNLMIRKLIHRHKNYYSSYEETLVNYNI